MVSDRATRVALGLSDKEVAELKREAGEAKKRAWWGSRDKDYRPRKQVAFRLEPCKVRVLCSRKDVHGDKAPPALARLICGDKEEWLCEEHLLELKAHLKNAIKLIAALAPLSEGEVIAWISQAEYDGLQRLAAAHETPKEEVYEWARQVIASGSSLPEAIAELEEEEDG